MKKQLLLTAGVCAVAATLYQGLVTRTYTIATPKFPRGQTFRVALLADLHSHIHGQDQTPLLRRIWTGMPQAVLMAGDIYDNHTAPQGVHLLLAGLAGMPMWYTPGNHEHRTGKIDHICDVFKGYGVHVLRDAWTHTEIAGMPVVMAGADDAERRIWQDISYNHVQAKADAFADMPEDCFSILNAHKPHHIDEYRKYPFDLIVSGHAHGGQVRIPPFCNGLFAPGQGILPRHAGGMYTYENCTHIISRGLSVRRGLPRVCNPPEVVFIDVQGTA